MHDSATRPFLSREFSTRSLLSSDGHFHKIKFILRHATFGEKNKNDMRYFNINMIRYPTPQITHDATHDRAHNSLVWFLNASTQLKFPAVVPCIFLKFLLWRGYVVSHTDPQASVWLYHELSYTSLCVNSGCLYQWESRDSSATRIFF